MTEAGGGFDLAEKPLPPEGGGELRRQHLDRHRATVVQVLREVDRRHPATAEFALDRVATGDGGLQAGDRVGHHEILLAGRLHDRARTRQRPDGWLAGFGSPPRNFGYPLSRLRPYPPFHARPRALGRRARHRCLSGGRRDRHRERRSEEHTSELQSLAYLVCRLLLEKKKKRQ